MTSLLKDKAAQPLLVPTSALGAKIEEITSHDLPPRYAVLSRFPLLGGVIYYVSNVVLYGLLAALFGVLHTEGNRIGYLDDFEMIFNELLLAASIYYFFRMPALLGRTFRLLTENDVFVGDQIKIDASVVKLFRSKLRKRAPVVFAGIYASLGVIFQLAGLFPVSGWFTINVFAYCVVAVTLTIAWCAMASVLVDVTLSIYLIHRLLRDNPIVVRRLHPDQAGGFGSLGSYSLRIGYFALIYGIWLASAATRAIVEDTFAIAPTLTAVVYVIAVPILFFLPIYSPHRVMAAFRNRLMSETAQKYSTHHQAIHTEIPETVKEFEQKIAYLNELQALQKHDASYPVWPFNFQIRAAVAFNSLAPAVPTVIGLLIDALK